MVVENYRIRKIPWRKGLYYLWGINVDNRGVTEALYRPLWEVTKSEGYRTIETIGGIMIYLSRRKPYIKIYGEQKLIREMELEEDNNN